jgi:signal peptidase II
MPPRPARAANAAAAGDDRADADAGEGRVDGVATGAATAADTARAAEAEAAARRRHEDARAAGFFWACAVFIADQLSKWAMLHVLELERDGPREITPFLELRLVWNPGISYGLLPQDDTTGRWLLVAFTVIASTLVLHWLYQARSRLLAISLGLILGGALGNLVDRVGYGAVVDFVHFHHGDFSWYVFNVADAAIVLGVVGLVVDSFRGILWERRSQRSVKGSGVASAAVLPHEAAAERAEQKT